MASGSRCRGSGPGQFSGWSKAKTALDKRIMEARQEAASKARRPAKDIQATEPWTLHDLRRTVSTGMHELGVEPTSSRRR